MIKSISGLEYKQFLEKLPSEFQPSVFNSVEWTGIFEKNLKYFGLFEKDVLPKAVFLAYSDKKGPIKILKSPPFSSTCHLLTNNPGKNRVKINSKEKKWLADIADFLNKQSNSLILLAFPPQYIDFQPFLWAGLKVTPQYTYRLNLDQSVEEIEKNMSPERRNDLKRGAKDGVEVNQVLDNSQVEPLIQKTFERKDKNLDRDFVRKILFDFAKPENSLAYVAKFNGENCATSFIIHNGHTAYYLLGGYDHEKTHAAAGAMALWQAIKKCKEIGIKVFDFEGSMLPEVERYFRGFGGQITPYYLVHKGSKAVEIALKFKKPELF